MDIEYKCSNCEQDVTGIERFDLDDTNSDDLYECPMCGWLETIDINY